MRDPEKTLDSFYRFLLNMNKKVKHLQGYINALDEQLDRLEARVEHLERDSREPVRPADTHPSLTGTMERDRKWRLKNGHAFERDELRVNNERRKERRYVLPARRMNAIPRREEDRL